MAATTALPVTRLTNFLRRMGWLPQVLAAGALVLVVAAVLANNYLGQRYSADGTAVDYVTAIGRGDAAGAWSEMTIPGGGPAGQGGLLSERALDGQLALSANRHPDRTDVHVTVHRDVLGAAQVTISFRESSRQRSLDLTLVRDQSQRHFLFYPVWLVATVPSPVELLSPSGTGGLSVDGVAVKATTPTLLALPGHHRAATARTSLFEAAQADFDVVAGSQYVATVTLAPTLIPSARTAAAAAIKAAFDGCRAVTFGLSCPMNFYSSGSNWQLIGDPTSPVTYAVRDGVLTASGHYQSDRIDPDFGIHFFYGGAYMAELKAAGQAFTVTHLQDGIDVPPLTRPSMPTDAAILQAVRTAFAACADSTQGRPSGCPQALEIATATYASNVRWQLGGDPLSGASVSWDGDQGAFNVSGSFSATATYDYYGSRQTTTKSGSYRAIVVPDSANPRVITIDGGS